MSLHSKANFMVHFMGHFQTYIQIDWQSNPTQFVLE